MKLYRVAAVASLAVVGLIAIQSFVHIAWPPPTTVDGFFQLFQRNWLLGLLDTDLLMIADYVLGLLVFLALYFVLRRASQSLMAVALALGVVGTAVYLTSLTPFNLLALSNGYNAATTDAQRSAFRAAAQATLAIYQGTAFDVGYVLVAIAWLTVAMAMLRGTVFSRATAYVGIVMGVMMLVPPTAGTVGLVLSLLSLVPAVVWFALIARRLLQLAAAPEALSPTLAPRRLAGAL